MSIGRFALCPIPCGILTIISALLSQMVKTMLHINLEVSSAFNFGLKPGAAFDSASVAHRLADQPSGFLAETTPLVSATSGMTGFTLHGSRWMSPDLCDLSLQPYFDSFWSSLRLAADNTFLWSPSFLVGCVIATS